MKKVLILLSVFLICFCSCSTPAPLKITDIQYEPTRLELSATIEILEKSRPDCVPAFPDSLPEGAGELDTLVYLGNVISAYKTSLEAWINYSEAQMDVLLAIQKEFAYEKQ